MEAAYGTGVQPAAARVWTAAATQAPIKYKCTKVRIGKSPRVTENWLQTRGKYRYGFTTTQAAVRARTHSVGWDRRL